MNRARDIAGRARRLLPWAIVTAFAAWITWPVPLGTMPLSADHPVHLQRAWLWADVLANGDVRGWSSAWFFGTPIGELYPVLGDLLVIGVRLVSLGRLDRPQAYALAFYLVFASQGWAVMLVGRRLRNGPWPGLIAALLLLADVGAYREGGWVYTVYYGVWPQALATSLTWIGLGELAAAIAAEDAERPRARLGWAAVVLGAALLAHPASLLMIAFGVPLAVLVLGSRHTAGLTRAALRALLALALALALAAWWLVPMIAARSWMASYGWLGPSLEQMTARVIHTGAFSQGMPSAVGIAVAVGLTGVAIAGSPIARYFAATGVVLWMFTGSDVAWALRLDLVSEGFGHLQYQRFITAAKPGLYLMAGIAVAAPLRLGVRWLASPGRVRWAGVVSLATAAVSLVALGSAQREVWRDNPVPAIQTTRWPGHPGLDSDYAALVEWLGRRWDERDKFFRATVRDARNVHWFVDATSQTGGMPIFKQGFTPGDNFVHKPESGSRTILDAAQVRYEIRRGRRRSRAPLATFGQIQVHERPAWDEHEIAWLRGAGSLEIVGFEPDGGDVTVHVSGSDATTRLVFAIAGHPRWHLEGPHGAVDWVETPIVGDGPDATIAERRAGDLRGGKAGGNDGTEPILIAAAVSDGEYVLHYRSRRVRDVLAGLVSVLAVITVIGVLSSRFPRIAGAARSLESWVRPAWLASVIGVMLLAGVVRVVKGRQAERERAVGWHLDGHRTRASQVTAGFLKADMLIRPALLVDARAGSDTAEIVFDTVALPERLAGYYALDDDAASEPARGQHRIRVELRGPDSTWITKLDRPVHHRPGRVEFVVDTDLLAYSVGDVRVTVSSEGRTPPALGFDLALPRGADSP